MRYRFKRFWRWLRGRCQMCGLQPPSTPTATDIHSQGPFCRPYNKTMAFARAYGIGNQKLKELIFQ